MRASEIAKNPDVEEFDRTDAEISRGQRRVAERKPHGMRPPFGNLAQEVANSVYPSGHVERHFMALGVFQELLPDRVGRDEKTPTSIQQDVTGEVEIETCGLAGPSEEDRQNCEPTCLQPR